MQRRAFASTVLALCAMASTSAWAQWPERPITLIVPAAAGSSPDSLSRLFADELGKKLGTSIIIENKPGAAGNIGMMALTKAKPDGYTLAYGNNATLATNEFLFKKMPYSVDELEPVIQLSNTSSLLVVRADSPFKSLKDLIEFGQKNPGRLTFASGGNGTSGHIGGELFKSMLKIEATHVPYKGAPQAFNDLMGGNVDYFFDNLGPIGPAVKQGQVRALGVTSLQRVEQFPDVPTLDEGGAKGFMMSAWGAIVAPKGTPADIVALLNKASNEVLQSDHMKQKMVERGSSIAGGSVQHLKQFMATERVKWGKVVEASGAKVD